MNWGATWSQWFDYTSPTSSIARQPWSGTEQQAWAGEHIEVRYWSEIAGSMEHIQYGDVGYATPRRWPHMLPRHRREVVQRYPFPKNTVADTRVFRI